MPRRGKSLESRVDEALRRAVLELLQEVGYAGLSIEAVAVRAGVGKAAVYRRWPSKPEMVFALAVHEPGGRRPAPDTGSLRGDLAALVDEAVALLTPPAAAAAIPGLLSDVARDPELGRRFDLAFFEEARARTGAVLRAALSRGELARLPDTDLALGLLVGPLFVWKFVLRTPAPEETEELAARVAAALRAADQGSPPAARGVG